jgi:3-phosphoshikimate 1-carboxyvinyltransferase
MTKNVPHSLNISQISAPASKSYAQRAILAAALCAGRSTIKGVGSSDDVQHIIEVAKQLGAKVTGEKDLSIIGRFFPPKMVLNCGESGLGMRMSASIAAAIGGEFQLIGKGSILERPMREIQETLPQLGVEVKSNKGLPPLHLNGVLQGGIASLNGSGSSQYLSGLLMALPTTGQNSVLSVADLKSIPYVQMTIELMGKFGIEVEHEDFKKFKIKGNQEYQATEYEVEGDWSGAAFWVVYGAICQTITISGLNKDSLQADKAIIEVLYMIGGDYKWEGDDLIVSPSSLNPFDFDATDCPDLFPALVVLAASIRGKSTIWGVDRLSHKESNRGIVLQQEFNKLGLDIQIDGNKMIINGTGSLQSGTINSNNDHRIAMAGAIAALLTPDGVKIEKAEAVSKSYPEFWDEIN